uniref:SAS-6_N domain-containing protein n=1 Tax=Angiostrongylus cantonensis TaxID=6313 RepID=A0A0K0DP87_ANGCA
MTCLDLPAPEQSCSNLIKRGENGTFPVISITFNLNESPGIEEFPENSFRNTIASALRVSPADILLLRINCQGTDDFLTVQFAVLKKVYDDNDDSIKYDVSMFVDAESVAARMKAMGHLSQIAGLQVDSIEFVNKIRNLYPSYLEQLEKELCLKLKKIGRIHRFLG